MRYPKSLSLMIGLALIALFLVACGAPPATPTPEIKTSAGALVIKEVQLADRFPSGCDLGSPTCQQVREGYQILIVWLKGADGGDPAAISDELRNTFPEVYVIAGDGSRTKASMWGAFQSRLVVGFTPQASAHEFKLFWPGNPATDLGK